MARTKTTEERRKMGDRRRAILAAAKCPRCGKPQALRKIFHEVRGTKQCRYCGHQVPPGE
jgi:Zn ribbon nucleic-acid-binding protein